MGDDLTIWGTQSNENSYQRIEIILTACNYLHAELGGSGDTIADECIANQTEQIDYLGNMKVLVYQAD